MPLVFSHQDNIDIARAIAEGGKIWKNGCLDNVKAKIKDHYIVNDLPTCCYCSRLFTGEFRMVIDVEHVLPQSKYQDLRFVPLNLNVACKRCNMNIKNDRVDFLTDVTQLGTDYFNSSQYRIVHPNLDVYTDHIILKNFRIGNYVYIKYIQITPDKGQSTYDFFELKELEVENIDSSQGIRHRGYLIDVISGPIRSLALSLLKRL